MNTSEAASRACLLKYLPKYYQTLKITSDWSVLRKMKDIKAIDHLELENYETRKAKKSTRLLIKLLKNKGKNMKSIPIVNRKQSLELGRFFPRIKILDLSPKWKFGLMKRQNKITKSENKVWRFYKRFWIPFRHLEHIEMYGYDYDLQLMIKEFNKHSQVLSLLKSFAINFKTYNFSHGELNMKNALKRVLESSALLNHITHLSFRDDTFAFLEPLPTLILQSCSKVSHLNVWLGNKNTHNYDSRYQSLMPTVSILQNLTTLALKIHHPQPFLEQLEFPASLENIHISLYCYDDRCLRVLFSEESETNEPIYSAVCQKFLKRWNKLTNLKVLEIYFFDIDKVEILNGTFLPSLLSGVPNIETIVLKFPFTLNLQTEIQLSPIFDALTHLKSLKNVTIQDEIQERATRKNLALDFTYDPEKMRLLSHITSFYVDALILEVPFLKGFIMGFLADSQQLKTFNFAEIRLNSVQSLIELFRIFNSCQRSVQHEICLKIHVCLDRIGDMLQGFESCLSLRNKLSVEMAIDFRAGSIVLAKKCQESLDLLRKIFPQFKVATSSDGEKFLLKNFIL